MLPYTLLKWTPHSTNYETPSWPKSLVESRFPFSSSTGTPSRSRREMKCVRDNQYIEKGFQNACDDINALHMHKVNSKLVSLHKLGSELFIIFGCNLWRSLRSPESSVLLPLRCLFDLLKIMSHNNTSSREKPTTIKYSSNCSALLGGLNKRLQTWCRSFRCHPWKVFVWF